MVREGVPLRAKEKMQEMVRMRVSPAEVGRRPR
jgi:hypothetical protein